MSRGMITVPAGRRIYGMQLPIQAQSSYFVADWEKSAGPSELARLARACDESGYAYVGVCDHVSLPESAVGGMGTHWADPIATLGWIAGFTSNVGLLTHVYVLPYRHPRVAAKQFATLDHLSEGRALIGIGAGHVQAEFELLGADFHARGKALDSGIPQLAAALENEFVEGFGARPLPAQSPRPPIWVAGSSPAAIKRAARLADGWLPQGPSNAEMVGLLRDEMSRVGRTVPNMMIGHITPF
ncbi:MAG: LLM class flavin-dependent oxidoreductase, partial [Actinomycetes bacterium]